MSHFTFITRVHINGSSTKTSDLLKEDSVLLKVILKVLKDPYEMASLCRSPLSSTVYLCVKQLTSDSTISETEGYKAQRNIQCNNDGSGATFKSKGA